MNATDRQASLSLILCVTIIGLLLIALANSPLPKDQPPLRLSNLRRGTLQVQNPRELIRQALPIGSRQEGDLTINHIWDTNDKVIVAGRLTGESTTWLEESLPEWRHAVYIVDNTSAPLHTVANKGHEANPYLTFLIDNYEALPPIMAFVHPHEDAAHGAWHNDGPDADHSTAWMLSNLKLDHVRANGYVSLRCTHTPGCPDEIHTDWEVTHPLTDRPHEKAFVGVWKELFANEDMPAVVAAPCCAQFAVTREAVLTRPKSFYINMHRFLLATDLSDATVGMVYEYLWHIVFGKDAVHCPAFEQCYANLYGYTTMDA